jgi:septum formation protein
VEVADVDETLRPGEPPELAATRLAREKARRIATLHPDALILAADTLVVLDEAILGKPTSPAHATELLERLSGRSHQVITGVALLAEGVEEVFAATTEVRFRPLLQEEIAAYVASGEPMDKAGAYGIQGKAAGFVRSIEGSYTNVVGLPLAECLEALRAQRA